MRTLPFLLEEISVYNTCDVIPVGVDIIVGHSSVTLLIDGNRLRYFEIVVIYVVRNISFHVPHSRASRS